MERKLHFGRDLIALMFMLDFVPFKKRADVIKDLIVQVITT